MSSLKAMRVSPVYFINLFLNLSVHGEPNISACISMLGITLHQLIIHSLPPRITQYPLDIEGEDKALPNLLNEDFLQLFFIDKFPWYWVEGVGYNQKVVINFLREIVIERF